MTAQLALFGAPDVAGPRPSDAVLLLIAEVEACIDHGDDDGLGAPEAGQKRRTVDAAVDQGLLSRAYVGDSDTEQGPRRLLLTAIGVAALERWGSDHRRYIEGRTGHVSGAAAGGAKHHAPLTAAV